MAPDTRHVLVASTVIYKGSPILKIDEKTKFDVSCKGVSNWETTERDNNRLKRR